MIDFDRLPASFLHHFKKLSPEAQEAWTKERLKAQSDALYLGTEVLGMDFQEMPHRALFNSFLRMRPGVQFYELDTHYKKRMVLWSRGTFKTSARMVAQVQTIINYPDVRFCHMTGGKDLGRRHLRRLKLVFTAPTEKFKRLFPEFCEDPLTDTASEFTVAARRNTIFAEPTFAISTAKSVKAGSHYDEIDIDDLVNETNYRSITALEKCYQDYLDITPLLEPSGYMIVTGTRYSFGDTYERIQEKAAEEEAQLGKTIWKFSIKTCWRENEQGGKDVLFPRVTTRDGRQIGHTVEFLEGEKLRAGAEFFANQYENNPIASGEQTFTEELIARQTLFHLEQIPSPTVAPTFIVGDLSYVGDSKRDRSVFYAVRLYRGQLFVFDCIYGKWDSEAVAENVVGWTFKHRPYIIWLERFLGWEAYDKVIRGYAAQRKLQRLPVEWYKMSNVEGAKLARIGAVKTPLKEGRLWLFAGMPGYDILCRELLKWPKMGRRDDFADDLGLVCEVPSGYETQSSVQPTVSMFRREHPLTEPSEGYYEDGGCGSGIIC